MSGGSSRSFVLWFVPCPSARYLADLPLVSSRLSSSSTLPHNTLPNPSALARLRLARHPHFPPSLQYRRFHHTLPLPIHPRLDPPLPRPLPHPSDSPSSLRNSHPPRVHNEQGERLSTSSPPDCRIAPLSSEPRMSIRRSRPISTLLPCPRDPPCLVARRELGLPRYVPDDAGARRLPYRGSNGSRPHPHSGTPRRLLLRRTTPHLPFSPFLPRSIFKLWIHHRLPRSKGTANSHPVLHLRPSVDARTRYAFQRRSALTASQSLRSWAVDYEEGL